MSHPHRPLKLAYCLYPNLTILDFVGPAEFFAALEPRNNPHNPHSPKPSPPQVEGTYFSHTLDPIVGEAGPALIPTRTYQEVLDKFEQYDIFLVPGGVNGNPQGVDPSLLKFIKQQAPGAKYILTVCTGSWIFAGTGLLNGKKATTNKQAFKTIVKSTDKSIDWIHKARWVVDGKIWTSSGVSAGTDMAYAFLKFLAGKEVAEARRITLEWREAAQDDDEFAKDNGLCDD